MGKKNLDRLFQEKLKDFSGDPDDKVWQAIEASLDKKKRSRRIIPVWWKLGGVAALLIIGISIWNSLENSTSNSPTITDINNDASEKNKSNQSTEVQNTNKEAIANIHKKDSLKDENKKSINQITESDTDSNEALKPKSIIKQTKKDLFKNQNTVVDNTPKVKNLNTNQKDYKISEDKSGTSETAIVDSKSPNSQPTSENIKSDKEATLFSKETHATPSAEITHIDKSENVNLEEKKKKKSIFEEIKAQEEEEEKVAEENSSSKWSAGPNIAPVYFNAIGEGSPINLAFVPNSKSGDINLSYGLSVVYEVNKKFSLRSGLNKVNYGYSTNDIEFSSLNNNTVSGQIATIDYTNASQDIIVNTTPRTASEFVSQDVLLTDNSEDVIADNNVRNGALEQQFGYLEVPVELKYALVDKRIGVHLIGGVSSLFLIDNSISLSSGNLNTEVGKANNINSVNFSTNVGFGVHYKFTPKVQLNIEPVFKYQLNTFSITEGSFNPFSIGLYSGLSFKF